MSVKSQGKRQIAVTSLTFMTTVPLRATNFLQERFDDLRTERKKAEKFYQFKSLFRDYDTDAGGLSEEILRFFFFT